MLFVFGDSWARHSARHIIDQSKSINSSSMFNNGTVKVLNNQEHYGYRHWSQSKTDVFVAFNTDDWFNSYFTHTPVINFAEFGNTNSWIVENLYNRMAGVSNISQSIDVVVFQTDPLRIFAPRQDYTNFNTVWPTFQEWCTTNNFDYQTQAFSELVDKIYNTFYQQLLGFKEHIASNGQAVNIKLVGGTSAIHPSYKLYNLEVLIPSVSELFGYTDDTVFENQIALDRFVGFWKSNVAGDQQLRILQDWNHYNNEVSRKLAYWTDTPDYFAGRHLTATAMKELAQYIESRL